MAEHTPELLLTEDEAHERAKHLIAKFDEYPDVLSPDEQALVMTLKSQARLIAAAPDLLQACRAAINDRMYVEWPAIADLLIEAIEKATGEKLR